MRALVARCSPALRGRSSRRVKEGHLVEREVVKAHRAKQPLGQLGLGLRLDGEGEVDDERTSVALGERHGAAGRGRRVAVGHHLFAAQEV